MVIAQTIDELQEKYDAQLHQCSDLSKKLEATEVVLTIMLLCLIELLIASPGHLSV